MFALGDPRPDDGGTHRIVVQHPARRDVGDRHAVPFRDLAGRRENVLKWLPSTGGINEALVFRAAPIRQGRWLALAEPPVSKKAATQGSIGQELHAALSAQIRQRAAGAAIDQRE